MTTRAALPAAMLIALACALPGVPALAQDQTDEASSDAPPKPADPTHTPVEATPSPSKPTLTKRPRLLESVTPKYPPEAWAQDVEGDVTLLLWVDEQGRVEAAEVVSTPGFGLETAALVAAKQLRFTPAEMDGGAVKVKIRYTFRFRKPEKSLQAEPPKPGELCPQDTRKKAKLIAHVRQRGTGKPLVGAEVYLLDLDEAVLTDGQGRLEKELPPGGYALTIRVPGHHAFESLQRLEPAETLEVELFVTPRRRGKYQTVVWGSEDESLVGRTTLQDAEIYEVPGTMGDPIRVVMLLPGVTSSASGVSNPVIRGSLPGDTRYEFDGVQVPMLYHLFVGSAVVNSRFTSGIDFQPSGYSVEHGHFAGALIKARGVDKPKERLSAFDVSLIQASGYHAQPITDDLQMVAAARYGTLGLIIEAVASDIIFKFWDYQFKTFYSPTPKDRIELIAFGAGNQFGEQIQDGPDQVSKLGFHRVALRWRHSLTDGWLQLAAEYGWEGFNTPQEEEEVGQESEDDPLDSKYNYGALRAKASFSLAQNLELRFGGEAQYHDFGFDITDVDYQSPDHGLTSGVYTELAFTPGDLTITPGLRLSYYDFGFGDDGATQTALEPRIGIGYKIKDWLSAKASAGMYSGPPRITIVSGPVVIGPVPGLYGSGLELGLTESTRFAAGFEVELPYDFQINLQGYYSLLKTGLDFSLMDTNLENECLTVCGEAGEDPDLPSTKGRAYGMELTVRRKFGEYVFGWINYSLSRSERDIAGVGTLPFVYDQTHVLNAVISADIGRNWTIGNTFHFHTGRPYTPEHTAQCEIGEGLVEERICRGAPLSGRLPSFWRIDMRIQKRELFETWHLDFYIDVLNLTFNKETIGYEYDANGERKAIKVPIFIPMLGLRGQF